MFEGLRRRMGNAASNHTVRLHRRLGRTNQRGAVLVEAAIALPTVTLLMFGILEYGLLFGDGMDLASTVRAASRTGASVDYTTTTSDFRLLQQVKSTGGRVSGTIQSVVVYRATAASGAPTDACRSGIAVVGICDVYTQADMNLTSDQLDATGHSAPWAPVTRVPGTDYIGVWIKARHQWITGLMGSGRTVADNAVMRVQPLPSYGAEDASGYWPLPVATTSPTTLPPTTTTTIKTSATTSVTTIKPTTTTAKVTTTTAKATTTTVRSGTTTTAKPTTTTAKVTTTTKKPTTTTVTAIPPPVF